MGGKAYGHQCDHQSDLAHQLVVACSVETTQAIKNEFNPVFIIAPPTPPLLCSPYSSRNNTSLFIIAASKQRSLLGYVTDRLMREIISEGPNFFIQLPIFIGYMARGQFTQGTYKHRHLQKKISLTGSAYLTVNIHIISQDTAQILIAPL